MSTNLNNLQRTLVAFMLQKRFDLAARLLKDEPSLGVNFTFNLPKEGKTNVTPLMLACLLAAKPLIAELLFRQADVEATDGAGNNALHYLVAQTCQPDVREAIAHTLLGMKLELLNQGNRDGNLPIHDVVLHQNEHAARLLLSYDEKLKESTNFRGQTPLQALNPNVDSAVLRAFNETPQTELTFLGPKVSTQQKKWKNPLPAWSKENHAQNDARNPKTFTPKVGA
jgi:ankyrin repeat protein